ncbi:hypothetical protein PCASD_09649 [Puccinia coronata f. sp. avenae]|uniref:Uncharacterized protein n=1 Tax=Puccinia coronata f. sp. avenae TaxID=200324 RepID=A0A2N5UHV9_9BASI|nr:hypothetical protein PCASD_09649 [Puccinia coronata f. sp. avenae]
MEISNPPKASNSPMITSDSTKKQLDDNSHFSGARSNKGSNQSIVPDSDTGHDFSDQESSSLEDEDESIFHPTPARNSSPPRDPIRIRLCLNQSHVKAPQDVSPMDVHKVGDPTWLTDPPPPLGKPRKELADVTGPKVSANLLANKSKPKPEHNPILTVKRGRGRPRKISEKDPRKIPETGCQPAPLTDAEWDQIEACTAANFSAIWKAWDKKELKEKERKANQLANKKTKGKKPSATRKPTINGKQKSIATVPSVGVRRSARGVV